MFMRAQTHCIFTTDFSVCSLCVKLIFPCTCFPDAEKYTRYDDGGLGEVSHDCLWIKERYTFIQSLSGSKGRQS